jgi:hypothetical protein
MIKEERDPDILQVLDEANMKWVELWRRALV